VKPNIIELIKDLKYLIEFAGVGIIIIGAIVASIYYIKNTLKNESCSYENFRKQLGRSILLGLEFLVAGDIINTVAVEPTIKSVTTLGLIVLIRTFLSFSLEIELEKKLPWQKKS
jgi:uncharacterized membrane protein